MLQQTMDTSADGSLSCDEFCSAVNLVVRGRGKLQESERGGASLRDSIRGSQPESHKAVVTFGASGFPATTGFETGVAGSWTGVVVPDVSLVIFSTRPVRHFESAECQDAVTDQFGALNR